MTRQALITILPLIALACTAVIIMLVIAFNRNHKLIAWLTVTGFTAAGFSLFFVTPSSSIAITPLLTIDRSGYFYLGLVLFAALITTAFSYTHLNIRREHHEEYYLLLAIATLGASVLTLSSHFVSLFLGLEILSVSLYVLTAYFRESPKGLEAGVKYLVLASVSSSFMLFGMALIYAETGSMAFTEIAARLGTRAIYHIPMMAGMVMIIIGLGFKLALVPFHLWTPDVYQGAPSPIAGFVATASKGAVFAVILRYFTNVDLHAERGLMALITVIAIASMFIGNILALLQKNVKRLLAYSSISHLGYLLVTLVASGQTAITAAAFYLSAYFVTMLGSFGVVTLLSNHTREAENIEDYQGIAWQRPWIAAVFTAMLLSLAGIPLTAGFVGKFYIVAAGVDSSLWLLITLLLVNSVIGLFYYLRLVIAMYSTLQTSTLITTASLPGNTALAGLMLLLITLGVYPGPLIEIIKKAVQSLV